MRPFLDAVAGNEKQALRLYAWHSDLTSAVQAVLGITEVVLRNAMDARLTIWNQRRLGQAQSWLLMEPATPLRGLTSDKRRDALRRATQERLALPRSHPRHGSPLTHDDVLAQTMFGMWKDLLPNHAPDAGDDQRNHNRARLWEEALEAAFPHAEDPTGADTYWRVAHLHRLRNRVSHMEPLLTLDVRAHVNDALSLVRSIDPAVGEWLSGISRVGYVLTQRP